MAALTTYGSRTNRWENPQECLGPFVGYLHKGAYRCWEPRGRASRVLDQLNPEIKTHIEASGIPHADNVTRLFYMVGRSRETAEPKLFICSSDAKVRDLAKQLIADSNILDRYPGVGLGHISRTPIRPLALSRASVEALIPSGTSLRGAVLVKEGPGTQLGKRIFIVNPSDNHCYLCPAIAGPVITHDGTIYQLTSAYPFQHHEYPLSLMLAEEYDFDGLSENETEDDVVHSTGGSATSDGMGSSNTLDFSRIDIAPKRKDINLSLQNKFGDSPRHEQHSRDSVELDLEIPEPIYDDPTKYQYFGKLAMDSLAQIEPTLDYALIQMAPNILANSNNLPSVDNPDSCPKMSGIGDIKSTDIDIVAVMPSKKPVRGILQATPSYIPTPGHDTFEKLHRVTLNLPELEAQHSCGAAVLGEHDDRFYGHIVVTGWPGPEKFFVYLAPATDVYEGIIDQFKHETSSYSKNRRPPGVGTARIRNSSKTPVENSVFQSCISLSGPTPDSALGLSDEVAIPQPYPGETPAERNRHPINGYLHKPHMKGTSPWVQMGSSQKQTYLTYDRKSHRSSSEMSRFGNKAHDHLFLVCPMSAFNHNGLDEICKNNNYTKFAKVTTHVVSHHNLIRGHNGPAVRYLTKCFSQEYDIRGRLKCELCKKVHAWTAEQLMDPAHEGNALCLRCFEKLPNKKALHHHILNPQTCPCYDSSSAKFKSTMVYDAFFYQRDIPRRRVPSIPKSHAMFHIPGDSTPLEVRDNADDDSVSSSCPTPQPQPLIATTQTFIPPPLPTRVTIPPHHSTSIPQFRGINGYNTGLDSQSESDWYPQQPQSGALSTFSTHTIQQLPRAYPDVGSSAYGTVNPPNNQHGVLPMNSPQPTIEFVSFAFEPRPPDLSTNRPPRDQRANRKSPPRRQRRKC